MCNLLPYIRENEIIQVTTYERKFINIVNWSNFLLLQFEEMKSCIYREEIANAGTGL